MILDGSLRYRKPPMTTAGRFTVLRNTGRKTDELVTELHIVEQEIDNFRSRTKELADELGAKYAVFRCASLRHDDEREQRDSDIMKLSKKTDEYIQSIYYLEEKRRELLHRIGK